MGKNVNYRWYRGRSKFVGLEDLDDDLISMADVALDAGCSTGTVRLRALRASALKNIEIYKVKGKYYLRKSDLSVLGFG